MVSRGDGPLGHHAAIWVPAGLLLWATGAGCALRADPRGYEQVTRAQVLAQTSVPVYGYRVLRAYPHDPTSYTEGLVVAGGYSIEPVTVKNAPALAPGKLP
jgi:glutaminyl-peptide cyclotransferase